MLNQRPLMRDRLRLYLLICLIVAAGVAIVVAASHDTTIHIWERGN